MSDIFFSYLKLGYDHIVDISSFDHILFVITLCAVYQLSEWRKIGIIITAFTLGHSITLILASFRIIVPNRYIIELLIPLTILISGALNLAPQKYKLKSNKLYIKYAFALFFGLIHGMGFSSFFTDLMGDASQIILPLFSFNVGIELGQFLIIALYYALIYGIYRLIKISYNRFSWFFSVLGILVSIILIFKRI